MISVMFKLGKKNMELWRQVMKAKVNFEGLSLFGKRDLIVS